MTLDADVRRKKRRRGKKPPPPSTLQTAAPNELSAGLAEAETAASVFTVDDTLYGCSTWGSIEIEDSWNPARMDAQLK